MEKVINMKTNQDQHKKAIKEIGIMFRKKWLASYQYEKQKPNHYESKIAPPQLLNAESIKPIAYLTKMTYAALQKDFQFVSTFLKEDDLAWNEVQKYDSKGGLCIYASVLLYLLLLENKEISKNNLKYIQGYYQHRFMEEHIFSDIYKYGAFGLHAYIELNGYVIDTTIHQIAFLYYPDAHREFNFIGETSGGVDLYGYEEEYKIVYKYAKKIAQSSKMSVEEWIQYHKEKMNDYVIAQISEIQHKTE